VGTLPAGTVVEAYQTSGDAVLFGLAQMEVDQVLVLLKQAKIGRLRPQVHGLQDEMGEGETLGAKLAGICRGKDDGAAELGLAAALGIDSVDAGATRGRHRHLRLDRFCLM
jgi:hypothetical protein